RRIDHVPVALDAFRLGAERFHFKNTCLPPRGRLAESVEQRREMIAEPSSIAQACRSADL
ncbi:MAG TPA: hypothetical protein VFH59_02945, partial [Frateuria sp.]|uniref:hypothetical protein n=1 Tax=Frateuria sp. TaxID=2211372 RepID=UPI002D7F55DB